MSKIAKLFVGLAVCFFIAACGGGGSDSLQSDVSNRPGTDGDNVIRWSVKDNFNLTVYLNAEYLKKGDRNNLFIVSKCNSCSVNGYSYPKEVVNGWFGIKIPAFTNSIFVSGGANANPNMETANWIDISKSEFYDANEKMARINVDADLRREAITNITADFRTGKIRVGHFQNGSDIKFPEYGSDIKFPNFELTWSNNIYSVVEYVLGTDGNGSFEPKQGFNHLAVRNFGFKVNGEKDFSKSAEVEYNSAGSIFIPDQFNLIDRIGLVTEPRLVADFNDRVYKITGKPGQLDYLNFSIGFGVGHRGETGSYSMHIKNPTDPIIIDYPGCYIIIAWSYTAIDNASVHSPLADGNFHDDFNVYGPSGSKNYCR